MNERAALWAAARRVGSTSAASIEPDLSVTSITEARSTGTATVACGRANASASAPAAAAIRIAGARRRQAGAAATIPATTPAPGWRTA